jgi:hypothetical protein
MSLITLGAKWPGEPSAGNRHARFDVAGIGNQLTVRLVRHSQRKRGATDRPRLRSPAPVLDPTVLFELLAGKQAFHGDTVTEILAAVLRGDPDWAALPAGTSTNVRALLRHCLQKDQTLRLRDAGDAGIEIQEALAAPNVGPTATSPATRGWRLAVGLGLAALVAAVVAGLAGWNLKPAPPPAPRPVTRFTITLPLGQQLAGLDNGPAVALSPDGTRLAYVASQGGTQQIYVRAMDTLAARPVPGTEGAVEPFFSPDGQELGFFSGGQLKKVSVNGGAALPLVDASFPLGASWGSQGTIAFAHAIGSALQQVSDAGGGPQPLTRQEKGEFGHSWPEFLPGGKAVLFAAVRPGGSNQIAVQSVGTGERRNLIPRGTQPRYALSGHLVYAQGGTLMAVPFDPQRLTATGAPVSVIEGVVQSVGLAAAQYNVSSSGSLVYVPGDRQAVLRRMVWVDRKGLEQALPAEPRLYRNPKLSPVEQRVAVLIEEELGNSISVYDLTRDTLRPLTFPGSLNAMGAWTPDGKRIAFGSSKGGPINLVWQLADGSDSQERLASGDYLQDPNSWSPDGQLAFTEVNPTTGYDIWVLRLSDRKAHRFLSERFNESAPQFSPDGRWLAYVSDESGHYETYVQYSTWDSSRC